MAILITALLVSAGLQEWLWRRLIPLLKLKGEASIGRGFSPAHLYSEHYLSAGHRLLGWYRLAYLCTGVLLLLTVAALASWLLGRTA